MGISGYLAACLNCCASPPTSWILCDCDSSWSNVSPRAPKEEGWPGFSKGMYSQFMSGADFSYCRGGRFNLKWIPLYLTLFSSLEWEACPVWFHLLLVIYGMAGVNFAWSDTCVLLGHAPLALVIHTLVSNSRAGCIVIVTCFLSGGTDASDFCSHNTAPNLIVFIPYQVWTQI